MSKSQKAEADLIGEYAKSIGREVIIVDDTAELGYSEANGMYKNGKIVLALNNTGGVMSVYFGHELFHDLKQTAPKQANELQAYVLDRLKSNADYDYNARFADLEDKYADSLKGKTESQKKSVIDEEIAANACFTVLSNEDNFTALVKQNRSIAEKVRDFFADFIEKIKNALTRLAKNNAEYRALQNDTEAKEKILAMFNKALESSQNNNTAENSSAKYALKEPFNNDYDFSKNIEQVSKMASVTDLKGDEFAKGSVDLITQVTNYFKSIGNKVDSKYGTVILNRTGVKSSVSHGIGRNKAIAFKAVPNVIEQGEIIDYQNNYKGRKYDTAVFAAPININNSSYYVAVVVNVNKNSNEYYLHEVAIQNKKEDETLFKTGNSKNATPSNASSSVYSLLNKLQNVNNDFDSDENVKFSLKETADYSYNTLISKPDMPFTNIMDGINYKAQGITRKDIVNDAVNNAKTVGRENENGNAVIYVYDIAKEIIVPKKAIQHSLDRRIEVNGPVVTNIGNILKNSIRINKLIPRSDNIEQSYVLVGAAKNQQNEPFIVSFVVNEFTHEVKSIDVLYSVNAKTEPAGSLSPQLSTAATDSNISISDLLDYVNRYYPDILPEDVLRHYGYTARPDGVIGESALYSLKEEDNTSVFEDNEELAESAEDVQNMLRLVSTENNELRKAFDIRTVRQAEDSSVAKVAAYLRKQYDSRYKIQAAQTSNLLSYYVYLFCSGR